MPWTQTEARLRETLSQPPFDQVEKAVAALDAPGLLAAGNLDLAALKRAKEHLPEGQRCLFERALLMRAAVASAGRAGSLAVPADVKQMLEDHFLALLEPSPAFDLGHPWFQAWALIAALRRFPAGQLDFECSGFPRSRLLKVPWPDRPRLGAFLAVQLRGFRPCFYAHVAVKRKNRFSMTEAESNRSYYRIAQALKLQPKILGLFAESWFHSPDTFRISPHLVWFNKVPSENGAFITTVGPADLDSGVFERSPERRKAYEEGKFRPTVGLMLWPRKQLLNWAANHAEWGGQ